MALREALLGVQDTFCVLGKAQEVEPGNQEEANIYEGWEAGEEEADVRLQFSHTCVSYRTAH